VLALGKGRHIESSHWLNFTIIASRFAEAEIVVVLALLISRYKVTVDTEKFPEVEGETKLQRRDRLLRIKMGITLTPDCVPLVFTKRC